MNATTTSNPSTDAILDSWSDSFLEGVITNLTSGVINLAEYSESTRLGCLRAMQTEAARRKARRLVEELGTDHPVAFVAILEYVELADPGATDRALKESGITLPAPTHVDANGTPFYTSEAIADAMDVPHDQVRADIQQMYALAPNLVPADGELHRIQ